MQDAVQTKRVANFNRLQPLIILVSPTGFEPVTH